ncbi:hypothetical protein IH86_21575 [Sphingobium yanoikuyae]|nr:hypothetical protein IH86_21575 [Sphingobium yanoikuyae]
MHGQLTWISLYMAQHAASTANNEDLYMQNVTPAPDDRLLSKSEVADRLSVHPATVDRWTKDGRITGKVRIGGRVGWRASAIQSLITAV